MFPLRYFCARFFARRFWPKAGSDLVSTPPILNDRVEFAFTHNDRVEFAFTLQDRVEFPFTQDDRVNFA